MPSKRRKCLNCKREHNNKIFCSKKCYGIFVRSEERIIERFWNKVDKRGPDECWEWQGGRIPRGYGHIGYKKGSKKHTEKTHRLSWRIHFGPIPHNKNVLHYCDNPPCANPNHLWLGTLKDNTQDMIKKGRHHDVSGENNPMAKLTAADVMLIRRLSSIGHTNKYLAHTFKMDSETIRVILARKRWRSI